MIRQIIFATILDTRKSELLVSFYEFANDEWKKVLSECKAYGGRNGFSKSKKEGDGKTPIGEYNIVYGFGVESVEKFKIPFISIKNQVWVDDSTSALYNTMQNENVANKWKSSETLNIPCYKYSLVVGYNIDKPIPGKGSAIFIHCLGENKYTDGCIALKESDMYKIMKKIDISYKPRVIIDTKKKIESIQRKMLLK